MGDGRPGDPKVLDQAQTAMIAYYLAFTGLLKVQGVETEPAEVLLAAERMCRWKVMLYEMVRQTEQDLVTMLRLELNMGSDGSAESADGADPPTDEQMKRLNRGG